jgi:hypothetical protein
MHDSYDCRLVDKGFVTIIWLLWIIWFLWQRKYREREISPPFVDVEGIRRGGEER